jgi:serine/threonine-protein kinase RsbW
VSVSALPQYPPPLVGHRGVFAVEGVADGDTLARCFDKIDALCQIKGLSQEDTLALRLCVDEVCANVVSYAYPPSEPGPMRLEVWWPNAGSAQATAVVLRVLDRGVAFDPSEVSAPDIGATVESRQVGGLGWFLVREMMDDASYERTAEGCNLSTLTRNLRGVTAAQ